MRSRSSTTRWLLPQLRRGELIEGSLVVLHDDSRRCERPSTPSGARSGIRRFSTVSGSASASRSSFRSRKRPAFSRAISIDSLAERRRGADSSVACRAEAAAAARLGVVPERFRGAGAGATPTFLQVDFGLVRGPDGSLDAQAGGAPGLPVALRISDRALRMPIGEAFDLPRHLDAYLGGLTTTRYPDLLRHAIVGDHDPAEVVLMEIEPTRQKTRPDFVMTEQLWGVRAIDTADVTREGRHLFYQARRQAHADPADLQPRHPRRARAQAQVTLPFDYRDDLDVEWTGHPEWYFRISKFSIPWLAHPSVPRTWFLDSVDRSARRARSPVAEAVVFVCRRRDRLRAERCTARGDSSRTGANQFILQERMSFDPSDRNTSWRDASRDPDDVRVDRSISAPCFRCCAWDAAR